MVKLLKAIVLMIPILMSIACTNDERSAEEASSAVEIDEPVDIADPVEIAEPLEDPTTVGHWELISSSLVDVEAGLFELTINEDGTYESTMNGGFSTPGIWRAYDSNNESIEFVPESEYLSVERWDVNLQYQDYMILTNLRVRDRYSTEYSTIDGQTQKYYKTE